MSEKDFKFHIPVEIVKSDKKDQSGDDSVDEWMIQGIASTPDQDLQGEEVVQEGLDISVLKAGRGLFNNDHLKGPENVLGQIDDADFVEHGGKRALLVKGYLFKHQERAKAYYNIMRSVRKGAAPRVHFSIEGKVLERDFSNTRTIKKARIDKVALTLDPVNPHTFADLVKSLSPADYEQPSPEAIEIKDPPSPSVKQGDGEIKMADNQAMAEEMKAKLKDIQSDIVKALGDYFKAMSAGAGHADAPETRTGGSALQTESLDKKPKQISYKKSKKTKKVNKKLIKSLIDTACQAHPDADPLEIANLICTRFEKKSKGDT